MTGVTGHVGGAGGVTGGAGDRAGRKVGGGARGGVAGHGCGAGFPAFHPAAGPGTRGGNGLARPVVFRMFFLEGWQHMLRAAGGPERQCLMIGFVAVHGMTLLQAEAGSREISVRLCGPVLEPRCCYFQSSAARISSFFTRSV